MVTPQVPDGTDVTVSPAALTFTADDVHGGGGGGRGRCRPRCGGLTAVADYAVTRR